MATTDPPQEGTTMNVKHLERRLAEAERQANAWGIDDRLRERREAEVESLQLELAAAYAGSEEPAGRRSRW